MLRECSFFLLFCHDVDGELADSAATNAKKFKTDLLRAIFNPRFRETLPPLQEAHRHLIDPPVYEEAKQDAKKGPWRATVSDYAYRRMTYPHYYPRLDGADFLRRHGGRRSFFAPREREPARGHEPLEHELDDRPTVELTTQRVSEDRTIHQIRESPQREDTRSSPAAESDRDTGGTFGRPSTRSKSRDAEKSSDSSGRGDVLWYDHPLPTSVHFECAFKYTVIALQCRRASPGVPSLQECSKRLGGALGALLELNPLLQH